MIVTLAMAPCTSRTSNSKSQSENTSIIHVCTQITYKLHYLLWCAVLDCFLVSALDSEKVVVGRMKRWRLELLFGDIESNGAL